MGRVAPNAQGQRKGDFLAGKYLLGDCLGIGGMGEVYRATNVSLGREVAIKVLSREYVNIEDDVLRFLREARAAAAVRHPNVVDVFDVARDEDGTPFIVQELLSGQDLEQYVKSTGGKLTALEALEIMVPVADAVGAAHARDVVHRDLKPANIFLSRDGNRITPKVLDFGACLFPTLGGLSAKEVGLLIGTPHYMAPEQIVNRKDVDARSDVWALGIILYELVVGETPFEAESLKAVLDLVKRRPVPPLARVVPGAPTGLAEVVLQCTDRDPARRFQNARALKERMEAVRDAIRGDVAERAAGRVDTQPDESEAANASARTPASSKKGAPTANAAPSRDGERSPPPTSTVTTAARSRLLTLNSPESDRPPAPSSGPASSGAAAPGLPLVVAAPSTLVSARARPARPDPRAEVPSVPSGALPAAAPAFADLAMLEPLPMPAPIEPARASATNGSARPPAPSFSDPFSDPFASDPGDGNFELAATPRSQHPSSPPISSMPPVLDPRGLAPRSPSIAPNPAPTLASMGARPADLPMPAPPVPMPAPPPPLRERSSPRLDDDSARARSSPPAAFEPSRPLPMPPPPAAAASPSASLSRAAVGTSPSRATYASDWSSGQNAFFGAAIVVPALAAFAAAMLVGGVARPLGHALRGESTVASGVLAVVVLVIAAALCAKSVAGTRERSLFVATGAAVLFGMVMIIVTFSASEAAELGVPPTAAALAPFIGPIAPVAVAFSAIRRARASWLDESERRDAIVYTVLGVVMVFLTLILSPIGVVRAPASFGGSPRTSG